MKLTITLSEDAADVVRTLRLSGESREACVDRLLSNLASISHGRDNYEEHVGRQQRTAPPARALTDDMRRVLRLLNTVGRDRQQRMISVADRGSRKAATICTYSGLLDDSTFEDVQLRTVGMLERRGLIKRMPQTRRSNYLAQYKITTLGKQAARQKAGPP